MHRINNNFLSITVPKTMRTLVTANSTIPIACKPVENSTLQTIKTMKNQNKNPILQAVKKFTDYPQKLEKELNKLLQNGSEEVCKHLINILAKRDKNSAHHARGVAKIATKFAKELGLSHEKTEEIKIAALVHDIGKIFTPSNILKKQGKLNKEELKKMAEHAPLGKIFLNQLGLTKLNKFFKTAAELAEKHHTSFDKLNLSKRKTLEEEILELSDVYDALRRKRPYKKAFSIQETLNIMHKKQKKDNIWNPDIYNKFMEFIRKTYC